MKNVFVMMLILCGVSATAISQSREKAERLAADFCKEKHKEKDKDGVKTKVDVSIKSMPDFKENLSGYAGKYSMQGTSHYLVLRQTPSFAWEGEYIEEIDGRAEKIASFQKLHIGNAVVSGLIRNKNGDEDPFEGVFINRIENGATTQGLGLIATRPLQIAPGLSFGKAFFKKTE